MSILWIMLGSVRALFRSRSRLTLESLALRQQVAVLQSRVKRPKLHPLDRIVRVVTARL